MSADQITCALRGNTLHVRASGIPLRIPVDRLDVLVRLLRSRYAMSLRQSDNTTALSPFATQSDVDKWLKAGNKPTVLAPVLDRKAQKVRERDAILKRVFDMLGEL